MLVLVTSQVTLGTFFGTRPYTSRSKSSWISARRAFHCLTVVTLLPFFIVMSSGSGYLFAVASSKVVWLFGSAPRRRALIPSWSIMFWWSPSPVNFTCGGNEAELDWVAAAAASAARLNGTTEVIASAATTAATNHCVE